MSRPRDRSRLAAPVGAVVVGVLLVALQGSATADTIGSATIHVDTAEELTDALANADPGDVIQMADGRYNGRFTLDHGGEPGAPITVRGSRNAVLDGGGVDSGYGFYLERAAYVHLTGFTVTNSSKGVMLDWSNHNVLDGLYVHSIGDEAVHFRRHSSNNLIRDSLITDTGLDSPEFAEGIYFGSAVSNWDRYTDGEPDRANDNKAINNAVGPGVTAESIDIKEGTTGGVVRGNTFYGQDLCCTSYNDSWVDVKGNDYLIAGNDGIHSVESGFQTHEVVEGWGQDNVFTGNHADVRGSGYGFAVYCNSGDTCGNVVYDDNTVLNADSGFANIDVTPRDGGCEPRGRRR